MDIHITRSMSGNIQKWKKLLPWLAILIEFYI